jgi:hypothetical protein
MTSGPHEVWHRLPEHAQRKIKHAVVAAVVAAATVMIGDLLNPRHHGHHRRTAGHGEGEGEGRGHGGGQDRRADTWRERESERHTHRQTSWAGTRLGNA